MKAWSAISAVVLVIVCGINVLVMVRRVPPPARRPEAIAANVVMRQERRMAAVVRALRRQDVRGAVGYLADVPAAELPAYPRGMEEYFLTQFALVPWILDTRAEECNWIVANLATSEIAARVPPGFRVAEDFGGGVWLLEKRPP